MESPDSQDSLAFFEQAWADCHDYSPLWDYQEERMRPEFLQHPLLREAKEYGQTLLRAAESPGESFPGAEGEEPELLRIYPVDLSDLEIAAQYIFGTSGQPVLLLDLEAHLSLGEAAEIQVFNSVRHEICHALQEREMEARGESDWTTWANEQEAENWQSGQAIRGPSHPGGEGDSL